MFLVVPCRMPMETTLHTYELVEAMLIDSAPCDILRWMHVCRTWNDVINSSENLRQRLGFKRQNTSAQWCTRVRQNSVPIRCSESTDSGDGPLAKCHRKINGLHLNPLFRPLFSKMIHQPSSLRANASIELTEAWQRNGASWRRMLIVQEAVPRIELQVFLVGGKDTEVWTEDVQILNSSGVTAVDVVDRLIRFLENAKLMFVRIKGVEGLIA